MKRTHVAVSSDPVDISNAHEFVNDVCCGAVASFVGITRQDTLDGQCVSGLMFETHTPLATAVLEGIVNEHRERQPELNHVYIHHRIGFVPVSQGNVVIAVSSRHRKVAFEAVQQLMDSLKATLPVWKKETFHNGSSRWMENAEFGSNKSLV